MIYCIPTYVHSDCNQSEAHKLICVLVDGLLEIHTPALLQNKRKIANMYTKHTK